MPPRNLPATRAITITIQDGPTGPVVHTDSDPPAIGRLTTPAQSLAMDVLRDARHQADRIVYGEATVPVLAFLRSLLNPEELGHAVTPEVRDRARVLLGQQPVESYLRNGAAS